MEGIVANLAQTDGPKRFLRLGAVLKFSRDSSEEEFKSRKPQIRDIFIRIINSKRAEDLLRVEGKEYLKEQLKASINGFLVDGKVIDIYYVNFQVN
jgi:flagellar FliL protein